MAYREVVVSRIPPMAAFRVALALSLVALVAWILCVMLLYIGLAAAGVWDSLNAVIGGIGGEGIINFGMVISVSALVGALGAILATLLAPLCAVIYNAVVDLFGGLVVEVEDIR
ncbi:DUF3566 domain-containing protein [Corynebacterium sp. zg-331]|uniref:DUF3566 domain-containing protein n=1 Tax=unclassified Corynebacterium TaxID=2624378 RepID=UPI00128DACE6|nr:MULTISPECIES: DUF3566 domain-containing protein [unclassified Corynebacterium]MBC3186471.1 DUF3566 domain-containing protein [Corynebacterium sp. zg-331]MPV52956.1 DUF3566 domain-containing protein [Corynebacterium sp. zg331]